MPHKHLDVAAALDQLMEEPGGPQELIEEILINGDKDTLIEVLDSVFNDWKDFSGYHKLAIEKAVKSIAEKRAQP
ncbi:MAG: hypothetical protein PVI43_00450 [Candidatus Bathyarchaeota archaeon]|jgi:hypothetical protein